MIILIYLFVFLWEEAHGWGFKNGIFHNSIWLEQAAGVYHREARSGKYKLTYAEAKAVCEYEGGHLATYKQLEAARKIGTYLAKLMQILYITQDKNKGVFKNGPESSPDDCSVYTHRAVCDIVTGMMHAKARAITRHQGLVIKSFLDGIGFHVCAAGWMAKGRVGYPIVKPGPNCGFGKTGIIDYGIRLNRSERWDAYCYNPHAKECGGVFTDPKRIFKSPGFPNEYDDNQICYWHIRLKYGQRIHLSFLDFDLEDDPACLADYVEVYDSYDDVHGFVGRYCGDELPEDIISTGNVMTLKFLSDASVTAGGFQIKYVAVDPPSKSSQGKNASTTSTTSAGNKNFLAGRFSHL